MVWMSVEIMGWMTVLLLGPGAIARLICTYHVVGRSVVFGAKMLGIMVWMRVLGSARGTDVPRITCLLVL